MTAEDLDGLPYPRAALAALVAASEDAVVVLDRTMTVKAWNAAAERLYGYDAEEVVERPVPALGGAAFHDLVALAFATGEVERLDAEARRRDGLFVSVSISAAPVRADDGDAELVALVIRETTEQRLAQEALADSAARLSEAQQLARVGLWLWDVASDTMQLSDELYRICGVGPVDFEGTLAAYLELVEDQHREQVRTDMDAAVAAAQQYTGEYRIIQPSGSAVWVEARGDPVLDADGTTLGLRGIVQDLTERRAAEERLQAALETERLAVEQLQEADRLKDEFLALVSHELRTPLAAIVGFSLALQQDAADSNGRAGDHGGEYTDIPERIVNNAEEMRRMVDRLLDFSRLEAGRVEVDPIETVLAEAVERICFNLAGVLGDHELAIDIPPSIRAFADADGLTRILGNLITNAVKFSPEGSTIEITARDQDGSVVVGVHDHGVGIDPEMQAKVFERFFQAPNQPVGKRGTGVGLAIVQRYVDLHGGRIWLESHPGDGSTFWFTLRAPATTAR
jgi:PAS domain S-box-containing protein